jgi:CHAD domain-containing protein
MHPSASRSNPKITGLRYWMERVLEECERVAADFSADPVHDLRVALRRCRSMADGLLAIDPDPDWKAMKKAGKRLFQRLGNLRDVQIMIDWIDRLHPAPSNVAQPPSSAGSAESLPVLPGKSRENERNRNSGALSLEPEPDSDSQEPAALALLDILREREREHKREAQSALEEFDRKQWRHWSQSLPLRAARFRLGSSLFKHLALERWTEARQLHARALRDRSQVAFHSLRIGIKRFRYIVENFLPEQHKAWSKDLKEIQDLLGEVHDLDVLWKTAVLCRVFPDIESRKRWHARILQERTKRIEAYRAKMMGADSLWSVWRVALPQGKQIQAVGTRRLKLWAKALDPDFAHSEHVARLALELYDSLHANRLLGSANGTGARSSLYLASLLHDVGKSKKKNNHHKASSELIKSHGAPLGWKNEDVQRAAIIARFHRGALPTKNHNLLRDLLPHEQRSTIQLAAILRLANALDATHDGQIRHVQVEHEGARSRQNAKPTCVVVAAEGYSGVSAVARSAAAERYLLETVLHCPVLVKPMKTPSQISKTT